MNNIIPSSSIASIVGNRELSYSQFCGGIEHIARLVRPLELDRTVPVALVMDRGHELYASQFAVLSTGGFFLPIDAANPGQRIEFLLTDSRAQCVLVDASAAERIRALGLDLRVIVVDADSVFDDVSDPAVAQPIVFPHGDDDPVYMIYTSGSTGQPKGVCIHWEAICNHNRGMIDVYQITASDRILQMVSVGFDLSIEVIFTTLGSGACLVTVDPQALDSPAKFLHWVDEQKLTLLNMPTALWHSIVPAFDSRPLPACVRLVTIGGERIKTELVDRWFNHISPDKVRLVHGYGPTETTITSTTCDLLPDNREAIGKPIANMECHIVSADGQLIEAVGEPGELYITGVSVAKGYWNSPEQTATAFSYSELLGGRWCYRTGDKVQWDEQGQLLFCGRIDNQVKFRGYRIELHEIEKVVVQHPEVINTVVLKSEGEREQLVCFLIPQEAEGIVGQCQELQQRISLMLKEKLPSYMVPARFLCMDELPTTVGGKVDTRKLLSMVEAKKNVQPAVSVDGLGPVESEVIKIWQAVLGTAPTTLDTTFEQSGGDSLAAMALALGLEKSFPQKSFGVTTLLSYPTINRLTQYIGLTDGNAQHEANRELQPIMNVLGHPLEAAKPVLVFLHPGGGSGYLYNQLLNETIKSNYSVVMLDSPWLTRSLPDAADQYTAVSIAKNYADALAERLPPRSSVVTAGYSFGGILAIEVARFLTKQGFRVTRVINIDQPNPAALTKAGPIRRLLNYGYRLKTPILEWEALKYVRVKRATEDGQQTILSKNPEMLRSFELEDFNAEIEDAYQPRRCDFDLHLIRGDIMGAKYSIDNDYGWGEYADSLTVHRVSGTHLTIFVGRHLRRLSVEFQNLL